MKNIMKKRSLKRKIAFGLALSMICSFSQTIGAFATVSNDDTPVVVSSDEGFNLSKYGTSDTTSLEESPKWSKIDVSISNQLELGSDFECTVRLKKVTLDDDGNVVETDPVGITQNIIVTAQKNSVTSTHFNPIENGTYIVEVEADGFATFTQVVDDVENEFCTLSLTAGFQAGYKYKDEVITDKEGGTSYEIKENHPGVLVVGDVDGSRSIDADDEDVLVKAIDAKVNDTNSDLNRDEKTDLADLQFFAKGYIEGKDKDTKAVVSRKFSPLAIKVELNENTELAENSDDVEDLFNEENKEVNVILKPSNDAPISEGNAVGIDIDPSKIDFSKCDSIEIQGNIKEAELEIEFEDESNIDPFNPIESEPETEIIDVVDGADSLSDGESKVTAKLVDGKIKLDLGNQIAVKKITLKITAIDVANGNNNLAQISKVEFVNGMEERISEPALDIPTGLKTSQGNMKITASWTPCVNVTEYEVQIATDKNFSKQIKVSPKRLTVPTITLESEHGNDKLIKNYTTYYIRVRSINGDWMSNWSEIAEVTPLPTGKPDKPDMVTATGAFQSMTVKWNGDNTNSTQSYTVFYRVRGTSDAYKEVVTSGTSCTITGLKDLTEYELYVVGHNEHGDSPASNTASTTTTVSIPAIMPEYGVINRDDEGKIGSAHIVSAINSGGGKMTDSSADEGANTAWGAVDGDSASYYVKNSWWDPNSMTFEFDKEYDIGSIALMRPFNGPNFFQQYITWWDEEGNEHKVINGGCYCSELRDKNNTMYFLITFPQNVHTKKIRIGFANYAGEVRTIAISEVYFYEYDFTMDKIMNLYEDNLHTVLKEDVTQSTIDALREKINAPDKFGNYNTKKDVLNKELDTAEKILKAENLRTPVKIHKEITNTDLGRNFSGLNAWQPLGVTMGTNETVTVYVGSPGKKTGEGTDLRLIVTQYNSEYGNYELAGANLSVGANTIKFAKSVYSDVESGGSMYVYHKNAPSNVEYSIRVDGGTEIPLLDLYGVTDEAERKEKAVEYIEKLDEHVAKLEDTHEKNHKESTYDKGNNNIVENNRLNFDYNEKTCIAGATEIVIDSMMYSLPAKQIQAGLGSGTAEKRAETLLQSMDSMEEMMYLFYQHKGLNANATAQVDKIPTRHLNIRYQRMFQGAAMYAAGNHIGIQWGSASGMVNSKSVKADENGKFQSGSYFGWGIAHEIGHCLNDGNYSVAEITNNYYSMLAQSQDKNQGSRLNYDKIYKKVTSNTKGSADQLTQLGLYWQLHLAYDKGYNYATYVDYDTQLDSLFYARMDTYSRTPSRAPKPGGTELSLSGDSDQKLMRLACAAAEKNILEFFQRWGKTPDATTIKYASQFPTEARAIIYANEDSRVYAMTGESSLQISEEGKALTSVIDNVEVKVGKTNATANQVNLQISISDNIIPAEDIFGYEIIRCTTSGGKVTETPVGFTKDTNFTDTVMTINNRTVFYKVTLIDQYLNRSVAFTTDMVKIQHDGSLDKTNWSISAKFAVPKNTGSTNNNQPVECDKVVDNPAEKAIDNKLDTVYAPTVEIDNAEIVIDFNQALTVTGMKYNAGDTTGDNKELGAYKVYVMRGDEWLEVAEGSFTESSSFMKEDEDGSKTIYFSNSDKEYVNAYEATALKIEVLNQKGTNISIAELDVLGVTGDNVDFRKDGETAEAAFGILEKAFKYGKKEEDYIPEGSVIFTGAYKGNPAYNVVLLYDEDGKIVGGIDSDGDVKAQQIILADVPESGLIANVTNGTWIYWLEPDDISGMDWPEKVRVELYRVNDALKNTGQRMVSDSLFAEVKDYKDMTPITISGNTTFTENSNTEVTTEGKVTTKGGDTE